MDSLNEQDLIFLPHLKRAEENIAARILSLGGAPSTFPAIDFEKAVAWCQEKTAKELAPTQRDALKLALSSRALVITGGPGVGKTTLVNAILLILRAKKVRCLLCAPTGRAAKRLAETTGVESKTIHRLLEVQPATGGFGRNEGNPLDCDLLVVDETSMVDVTLMANLLRALPPSASLLLVGDIDQLPSVGPGMMLRHIIESKVVPVVRLTEVFRQAAHSRIITNTHRINEGQMPGFTAKGAESDFFFIDREEPEQTAATLVEMVKTRIPAKFGLDPIRDIQVLCPMNRGSLGVRELNVRLQNELNPARADEPVVEKFGWLFRPRDKVIQTENDYDKDVFNGDIGQIVKIDHVEKDVVIRFDQREVVYDFGELDEIGLAYAITIHKSQGSEFPAVITPLAMQQYLRTYYESLLKRGELMPKERLSECYALFRDRFGPERLKSLDGEALLNTMHAHGSQDSLVYWLEFKSDDEFPTRKFGSIAGGSALKFGLYKNKNSGDWMTGHPTNQTVLPIAEAIATARKHRDQLIDAVTVLQDLPAGANDQAYLALQNKLDEPDLDGVHAAYASWNLPKRVKYPYEK